MNEPDGGQQLGYAPWMATLADFFTENAFSEGTTFRTSDAAIL